MYGFTYLGRHSSEFGLSVLSVNRPLLPAAKESIIDTNTASGIFDYSSSYFNDEHFFYEREIRVQCSFKFANLPEYRSKCGEIGQWLGGKIGHLVFDDDKLLECTARVVTGIDVTQKNHIGTFEVTFHCSPHFSMKVLRFGDNFAYGQGAKYTNGLMDRIVCDSSDIVLSPFVLIFDYRNNLSHHIRPVITIEGAFDSFSIAVEGGNSMDLNKPSTGKCVIDCEREVVSNGDIPVDNVFLTLKPGLNTIYFVALSFGGVITIEHRGKFM